MKNKEVMKFFELEKNNWNNNYGAKKVIAFHIENFFINVGLPKIVNIFYLKKKTVYNIIRVNFYWTLIHLRQL